MPIRAILHAKGTKETTAADAPHRQALYSNTFRFPVRVLPSRFQAPPVSSMAAAFPKARMTPQQSRIRSISVPSPFTPNR